MDGAAIAWTGLGIVVLGNFALLAYGYGRISQKVSDLQRRLGRVEQTINGALKSRNPNT